MRLSIAIVNWNTTDLLAQLIRSIHEYAPPFDYEIVVVDNASEGFDRVAFGAEFGDVRLIANQDNAGYAKGNNQAFEIAGGDYVLLLNPDTRVTEGAIETLVRFMGSHPDAGAAGAKLVRPNGSVDKSVRSFPYPGPVAWECLGLSRLFPANRTFGAYRMTHFAYDTEAKVDQPMGSCLIVSRKALDDIGGFDEQFPIFFNEVDWLFRARQQGYEVYFTPDSVIIHEGGAGTKQAGRRRMIRESHDSMIRFYRKHFRKRLPLPLYGFTVACIVIGKYLRGLI